MTTCDMKYVDNVLDEEQGLKRFKNTTAICICLNIKLKMEAIAIHRSA